MPRLQLELRHQLNGYVGRRWKVWIGLADREAAQKARAADQERIKQHGNPMVRSSAESQELRKRQILRDAGLKVGYRQ